MKWFQFLGTWFTLLVACMFGTAGETWSAVFLLSVSALYVLDEIITELRSRR